MTVDEVKILLSDLNRGYNTPYSSAEQATIERLYYEVLGKHLNGCRCPDKWHDAELEINSYIKKHGKMKEKSNYKLRAGVILQIAGSSEIYTNDNLTDEVAAAFLKEHPNAAGRFEVIPTAEKDAEAPKAGGESSELEAAHNRIAILESEKVELESRCRPESPPRRPPKRRPLTTRSPAAMTPEPKALTKPTSGPPGTTAILPMTLSDRLSPPNSWPGSRKRPSSRSWRARRSAA